MLSRSTDLVSRRRQLTRGISRKVSPLDVKVNFIKTKLSKKFHIPKNEMIDIEYIASNVSVPGTTSNEKMVKRRCGEVPLPEVYHTLGLTFDEYQAWLFGVVDFKLESRMKQFRYNTDKLSFLKKEIKKRKNVSTYIIVNADVLLGSCIPLNLIENEDYLIILFSSFENYPTYINKNLNGNIMQIQKKNEKGDIYSVLSFLSYKNKSKDDRIIFVGYKELENKIVNIGNNFKFINIKIKNFHEYENFFPEDYETSMYSINISFYGLWFIKLYKYLKDIKTKEVYEILLEDMSDKDIEEILPDEINALLVIYGLSYDITK